MFRTIVLTTIIAFANQGCGISLDGPWNVKILGKTIVGHVPGGIYTDLVNAKLIPENLKGSNDVNNRWVGNQSVTYSRNFEVDETTIEAPRILLIFHGLDTFATIFVNDHEIGKTSNMFVRYTFDVKQYLKLGSNSLIVEFSSAIKMANDLYDKQSVNYTVPPICVPKVYNGECHVNHMRKMQSSFGWDWGPAFPSSGIWKNVELISVGDATILESTVDVEDGQDTWNIIAKIVLVVAAKINSSIISGNLLLELETNDDSNFHTSKEIALIADEKIAVETMMLKIPKNKVEKWWPNGYGNQSLYTLNINLQTAFQKKTTKKRIGFRKIELVQTPLSKGLTFYFRINDVAIFAKGSNWIPTSVFPESTFNEIVVRNLLESSKLAHMNMLRVWGGGIYETDYFYNLADEYGIMIWQDFMFACSMYPTDEKFLSSVKMEIVQNVERLKHHSSIVIWAGNNENEAAIYGNWYGTGTKKIYKHDYLKLYVEIVKREVESLDRTRPFVVSSPSDGLWTDQHNFIGENPYSNFYGDVHYYNYMANGWDINQYPTTRFASEYGFQSLPSLETFSTATEKIEDLEIDSEFMKHRQHLLGGSIYMKFMISKNFVVPRSNDSHRDFADYVYLSQIYQSVAMRIQTESYRQMRSSVNDIGEGYTMGALYWQLNDVWQAPSWSSIEFTGRWKMLHHFAVEFFSPIIVTPRLSRTNDLTIYIVSDKLSTIPKITHKLNIYNWNSSRAIFSDIRSNITIVANGAQTIETVKLDELLVKARCGETMDVAKKNCFVELVLEDDNQRLVAPINYVYPAALKDVTLPSASVTVHVDPVPIPGKFANYLDYKVVVDSNEIALFVWLEISHVHGRFSENGFNLVGRKKNLVFHASVAITADELSKKLKIFTLSQLYDANR